MTDLLTAKDTSTVGYGMTCTSFKCHRCDRFSPQRGCGVRLHLGTRARVCAQCRDWIDTRRANAAKAAA